MARDTSFYYSFLVLPPAERRAIVAVWDFCRAVDDAADEAGGEAGAEQVREWRAELERCFDGATPQTAQGRALQPFIAAFHLPRPAFDALIEGVEMDLRPRRYATFADLYEYCIRVASAVGLMCVEIFGCRDPGSRQYAIDLGVALQLTNILRDVKDDYARGRVYLPLADLRACGCTVDDLSAGVASEPVRRAIAFECRRAREFYDRARRALPETDRRRLVAAEIMRAVYFETLKRIERAGHDVFTSRVRVPKPMQALIALRQWLWA